MINSKRFNLFKLASVVLTMGALTLITGCGNNTSSLSSSSHSSSSQSSSSSSSQSSSSSSSQSSSSSSSQSSSSSSSQSESSASSSVISAEKNGLVASIAAARLNKESVVVSADGTNVLPALKWVTAADKTNYANAIATAQTVIDNESATQAQVDSAVVTLAAATVVYNNAKDYGVKVNAVVQTIDLGQAADFVVLAKTGVSTTGTTAITGNIGVSPAAATYITGFDLSADATNQFSLSTYVTGHLYAADYSDPTPAYLTTSVNNMETALTTGNGLAPDATELYAGDLSGQTLPGGVYKWSNDVLINTDLTLSGSATDTWIFQIAGKLTEAENMHVILAGGALAKNIFWVVADTVAIGVGAHIEGNILAQTDISMGTGSSINGRLLAQTAVTLDAATIVYPS